jgi:hypothetical protein
MVASQTIRAEILRIARENIGANNVKDVLVEDDVDLFGEPSLRLTIVLNATKPVSSSGDVMGRISTEALEFLLRNKDDRYPYTHYITARELAAQSRRG